MPKIIGVTGTLGAGKRKITDYFVIKLGFEHVAVSDTFLQREALRRRLIPNREARTNIANEFRAQGPTKLMEAVYALARPLIEAGDNVVIEPQHTVAEVEFIKSLGGVVLGVDADLRIRYARIKERGGPKDHVSFEEFERVQAIQMASSDPNKNNLAAALAAADYHLTNNGTLAELYAQIEQALASIRE